jgi:hypothetical protein
MTRLTKKLDQNQGYLVEDDKIIYGAAGFTGDAVDKLAKFENFYDDLVASQDQISKELESLRNEGKEKSVKFRELLGKKLMNNNTLILLKAYGLE